MYIFLMDETQTLKIDLKNLDLLAYLPSRLVELYCGYIQLTHLPELPHTLRVLNCPHNRLRQLPKLPALTVLDVTSNCLSHLHVPKTLTKLYCSFNDGIELSTLPIGLKELYCCNNHMTELCLPPRVEVVYCSYNQLSSLTLPDGLKDLCCDHNRIKRLVLPETLVALDCVDNQIASLVLPSTLRELSANYNRLTSVTLNKGLSRVNLSGNPIREVPALHKEIMFLNLNHTLIERCFEFHPPLGQNGGLYFSGTPLYTKMKAVVQTEMVIFDPVMIHTAFDMIRMIEGKFNENYYGLKIKEGMMAWLWRARESLAKRKYHPDELWKMLLEEDYDALEGW